MKLLRKILRRIARLLLLLYIGLALLGWLGSERMIFQP